MHVRENERESESKNKKNLYDSKYLLEQQFERHTYSIEWSRTNIVSYVSYWAIVRICEKNVNSLLWIFDVRSYNLESSIRNKTDNRRSCDLLICDRDSSEKIYIYMKQSCDIWLQFFKSNFNGWSLQSYT